MYTGYRDIRYIIVCILSPVSSFLSSLNPCRGFGGSNRIPASISIWNIKCNFTGHTIRATTLRHDTQVLLAITLLKNNIVIQSLTSGNIGSSRSLILKYKEKCFTGYSMYLKNNSINGCNTIKKCNS